MPGDKGKARAGPLASGPSERTPLLPSTSTTAQPSPTATAATPPRRWTHYLVILSLILLSLFFAVILLLALLLSSFRPSSSELDTLPTTAFAYHLPPTISVLNVTDDGLLLNISVRCGIDYDAALGIKPYVSEDARAAAEGRGERGVGARWWEGARRWTGRRMLGMMLLRPEVDVHVPDQIFIFPHHFSSPPLLSVLPLEAIHIPLVPAVPASSSVLKNQDPDWLQHVSFTALARPIASVGQIWEFAQHAWAEGEVRIVVGVERVQVEAPVGGWLQRYAKGEKGDVVLSLAMDVPRLPGLPLPGKPLNLPSLINLTSYSFQNAHPPGALSLSAHATLPNLLRGLSTILPSSPSNSGGQGWHIPFSLPFSISLPGNGTAGGGETKMAEVVTRPLNIGKDDREIAVDIIGRVTANLSSTSTSAIDEGEGDDDASSSPLSHFLQNYLHGLASPIVVRGLPYLPPPINLPLQPTVNWNSTPPPSPPQAPPPWLLTTLPSLSLGLTFPGPIPKPKIIQAVTIERMRLAERAGKMRASGIVVAEVEMPAGMRGVSISVDRVRPDVLVFNGPVEDDDEGRAGEGEDYPSGAFGHIHPDEYLDATTTPHPTIPERLIVRAPMTDVPLDILPGRDKVLSDFVGKVVFKGGAVAGIDGTAGVGVEVDGVQGVVKVGGLPVRGEVWVGRGGRFGGHVDAWH